MKLLLTSFISLFFFCSCRTAAIHVEYNEDVDFTRLKTFKWFDSLNNKSSDYTTLKEQRVSQLIKDVMEERGLLLAEKADVLIAINVVEKEKVYTVPSSHSYSTVWGYHGRWEYEPHYYTESTLVIAFIDPQSKKSFWEGSIKDWHFERLSVLEMKKLIIELFKYYPLQH